MSDFGKSQLLKYGWTEGKGLGKEENGIVQPIKPKLKFDLKGVGHKNTDENWWQSVFNKASQNILIEKNSVGVSLKTVDNSAALFSKNEDLKEIQKKHSSNQKEFIRTSVLENGKVTQEKEENEIEAAITNLTINDEELFIACGGRTAHKGARHGITLSGKLARIARQEEEMSLMKTEETQTKVKTKKKRSKKKETIIDEEGTEKIEEKTKKMEKKEKKRKRKAVDTESEEDVHDDDEISHLMNTFKTKKCQLTKHQRKVSKRKINNLTELLDKAFTLEETEENIKKEKKKKKKAKKEKNSGTEDAKNEFIIAHTADQLQNEGEDFLEIFKDITFKRYEEQEPNKFTVAKSKKKNKEKLKEEEKMLKLSEQLNDCCTFSKAAKKTEHKKSYESLDDSISTIDLNKLNSRIDKKKKKRMLKNQLKNRVINIAKSSLDFIN